MAAKRPDADAPDADWLVYADALQQENDPRGALIALGAAGRIEERDRYVREHAESLFGAAITESWDRYRFTWRHSLIDAEVRVERGDDAAARLTALLDSRMADGIVSLAIVGVAMPERGEPVDVEPAIDALTARGLPPACGKLALVDERARTSRWLISRDWDPPPNLVHFGQLGALFDAVPALEELTLVVADAGQLELGKITLPELRAFRLECLSWPEQGDALAAQLANASWPKLSVFEARIPGSHTSNRPDDADAYAIVYDDPENDGDEFDDPALSDVPEHPDWAAVLRPLLRRFPALPLERLALTSCDGPHSLLPGLFDAGLPPTLRELDLSDGWINDIAGGMMLKNAAFFAPLKTLILRGVPMSDAMAKQLASMGPTIVHSTAADAPRYRYVVGQE